MDSQDSRRNKSARAFLGLGSNLGDKQSNLDRALELLSSSRALTVGKLSSVYLTEPVDLKEQEWFLNRVAEVFTSWNSDLLLQCCLQVENQMGRRRTVPKGPRIIDIDLLLYEDCVIKTPNLQIPHPHLHLRRFVLMPLVEIAPDLQHPFLGKSMAVLLLECPDFSKVVLSQ